jgi:hypothetical protein
MTYLHLLVWIASLQAGRVVRRIIRPRVLRWLCPSPAARAVDLTCEVSTWVYLLTSNCSPAVATAFARSHF